MRRKSFLSQVEAALWAAGGGGEAATAQVTAHLGLATPDRRKVARRLNDLVKGGRAERLGPGVYRPVKREPGAPEKKEVMWHYLRARRRVTKAELMGAADAGESTVKDWLGAMERLGLVKNEAGPGKEGVYRLVVDPVLRPEDDLAAKQRRKREQKKATLAQIDALIAAAINVRLAVSQWEEG